MFADRVDDLVSALQEEGYQITCIRTTSDCKSKKNDVWSVTMQRPKHFDLKELIKTMEDEGYNVRKVVMQTSHLIVEMVQEGDATDTFELVTMKQVAKTEKEKGEIVVDKSDYSKRQ